MGMPTHVHVLTAIDPPTRTGVCRSCGPVKIAKHGAGWRCRAAKNAHTKAHREAMSSRQKFLARLRMKYKMSLAQWDALLIAQSGRCDICCEPMRSVQVDHDHACCPKEWTCGGCVRGLLCPRCNLLIARIRDSVTWLGSATAYLSRT